LLSTTANFVAGGAGAPDKNNSRIEVTKNGQPVGGTDVIRVTLCDGATNGAAASASCPNGSLPVPGVLVTFNAGAGSTLTPAATCTTDANGQCSVGLTSNVAAGYIVETTKPIALGPAVPAPYFVTAPQPQNLGAPVPMLDPRLLLVLAALLALVAVRSIRRTAR
jgi:hypothetical protein